MNKNSAETIYSKAFERAVSRMFSAVSSYYIWKWFELAVNINSPGGKTKAERNVSIMSRHSAVIQQIRVSAYKTFVSDFAIFFDKNQYDESFSMDKLLLSAGEKLSQKDLDELREKIKTEKRKHGKSISFILELRNADVSHQELESKPRKVIYKNVEDLILSIQELLNLISHKYEQSSHMWNHIETDIDHQMNWIIDNLERGEEARLKEIEEWSKHR